MTMRMCADEETSLQAWVLHPKEQSLLFLPVLYPSRRCQCDGIRRR